MVAMSALSSYNFILLFVEALICFGILLLLQTDPFPFNHYFSAVCCITPRYTDSFSKW